MAYTKANLLDDVARASSADKATVERVLTSFFATVTAQAQSGNKVAWPGFGSFALQQRSARTGRNPRTGQAVRIPASKSMKFSASSTLKETLNARAAKKATTKKATTKKAAAKKAAPRKASPAKKAAKATKKR